MYLCDLRVLPGIISRKPAKAAKKTEFIFQHRGFMTLPDFPSGPKTTRLERE